MPIPPKGVPLSSGRGEAMTIGLKALRAGVAQGAGDLNPARRILHKVTPNRYVQHAAVCV